MLSILSITVLSILIIVVLNSQSDNSNISTMSGFGICLISLNCFLVFRYVIFSLYLHMMYEVRETAANKPLVM